MSVRKKDLPHTNRTRSISVLSLAALDVLLSETASFLLSAGLPRDRLAAALRAQARKVDAGGSLYQPRAAKIIKERHENLVETAGVVHDWHRQRAYADKRGDPRPLSISELRRLVSRRFSRDRVTGVVRWMQANRVITQGKDKRFLPAMGRHVILGNRRMRALDRTAALVPQYYRLALQNALTRERRERGVDRDARVFLLPKKFTKLWRAVALERTESFLEGLDNWLEDHTNPEYAGPTVEAALHSYCYTGESRQRRT
jgi:hypothetical protein